MKTCIVCKRPGAKDQIVDGVRVVACKECLDDRFRRPLAVEFTLKGRP